MKAIFILFPLAAGSLSSVLSGNMANQTYSQPDIAPSASLFPIVWTILYVLMGVSSYMIYNSNSSKKESALRTYALQLFFNFCWSIVFFRFSWYLFSFVWLLILIVLICMMIYQFYQIKPLAAYLQIPYLLWCTFAAYLNYQIFILN